VSPEDADELLQEAYCRIAMLDRTDHIDRPSAYFFSIVRNLLARRHRRQRVVSLELMAEIDAFEDGPANTFEEELSDRLLFDRIVELIDRLPARCREVVRLRKLEDWSHRQIATHLGISEKTVESQVRLGLRAVRRMWDEQEASAMGRLRARLETGAAGR